MAFENIENLRIVKESEEFCDAVWDIVDKWGYFAKDTVGRQLVKSSDSIGANIVESQGRYHPKDSVNFLYVSRGSLKEAKYWLKRARKRNLLTEKEYENLVIKLDNLAPQLNAFITSRRKR